MKRCNVRLRRVVEPTKQEAPAPRQSGYAAPAPGSGESGHDATSSPGFFSSSEVYVHRDHALRLVHVQQQVRSRLLHAQVLLIRLQLEHLLLTIASCSKWMRLYLLSPVEEVHTGSM